MPLMIYFTAISVNTENSVEQCNKFYTLSRRLEYIYELKCDINEVIVCHSDYSLSEYWIAREQFSFNIIKGNLELTSVLATQ